MPKFIFQCANCSKSYQKTEDLTGRKVKCGRCKTVFVAQAELVADQTRNSPVDQVQVGGTGFEPVIAGLWANPIPLAPLRVLVPASTYADLKIVSGRFFHVK